MELFQSRTGTSRLLDGTDETGNNSPNQFQSRTGEQPFRRRGHRVDCTNENKFQSRTGTSRLLDSTRDVQKRILLQFQSRTGLQPFRPNKFEFMEFMKSFNPERACSHLDNERRYRGNQMKFVSIPNGPAAI